MQSEYVQLLNPMAQDLDSARQGLVWEKDLAVLTIPHGQDAHRAPLACALVSVALADYFLRLMPNAVVSLSALTNAITYGAHTWRALNQSVGLPNEISHALYYMQDLGAREIDGASFINLPSGDFGGDGEYKIDLEEQLEWSGRFSIPVCAIVLATTPTEGLENMTLRQQMESRGIGYTYCVVSYLGCQERYRKGGHPSLTPFYITDSHGKSAKMYRARTVKECASILRDTLGVDPEVMDINWTWVRNPDIPCTAKDYDAAVAIARAQYEQIPDYPIRVGTGGSLLIPDTRVDDDAERAAYITRIKRGANTRTASALMDHRQVEKPYEDHEYSGGAASSSDVRTDRRFVQRGSMYHPDASAAPYIDTHVSNTHKK